MTPISNDTRARILVACGAPDDDGGADVAAVVEHTLRHARGTGAAAERAAIITALRRWAEDGGDPWMSYCAGQIEAGAHLTPKEQTP